MKPLDQLRVELDKCVRCGTCRSVCPTFKVIGRETASARGRGSLIDAPMKGELGLTEADLQHIKEGPLCKGSSPGAGEFGEAGLLSRFPLPLMGGGRLLPPLARSFFLELPQVRE